MGSSAVKLDDYRAENVSNLFIVGTYAKKVTVLQQQTRSLNLVHALIEEGGLIENPDDPKRIAVVGAGFTGLTAAAAILKKAPNSHLTIFERRDTLIPLQQGSDSRWLHPRIYDWPDEGSESNSAMLPVMNWTAGRASDVAVQFLGAWQRVVSSGGGQLNVKLYCNTRHLKIVVDKTTKTASKIEWIGEVRDPTNGAIKDSEDVEGAGCLEKFDLIVLCIGFGLESSATQSYWRNETLAQPSLTPGKNTFLVSGVGDGGIVDLLRIRVSNFRQDRILGEVFNDRAMLDHLRNLKEAYNSETHVNLFTELNAISEEPDLSLSFEKSVSRLRKRLRRDSGAILNTVYDSLDVTP